MSTILLDRPTDSPEPAPERPTETPEPTTEPATEPAGPDTEEEPREATGRWARFKAFCKRNKVALLVIAL